MCFIKFLLKPRKEMAKKNTARVRVGKYIASSHSQNRIVERSIKKIDVIGHVYRKPIKITKIKYDGENQPSYDRIGVRVTTSINPNTNVITTIHPTHSKLKKRGNKSCSRKK